MTEHPNTINFTRGVPATESFPIDDVMDAARAALKAEGSAMLQYGPAAGFRPCRRAGGAAPRTSPQTKTSARSAVKTRMPLPAGLIAINYIR